MNCLGSSDTESSWNRLGWNAFLGFGWLSSLMAPPPADPAEGAVMLRFGDEGAFADWATGGGLPSSLLKRSESSDLWRTRLDPWLACSATSSASPFICGTAKLAGSLVESVLNASGVEVGAEDECPTRTETTTTRINAESVLPALYILFRCRCRCRERFGLFFSFFLLLREACLLVLESVGSSDLQRQSVDDGFVCWRTGGVQVEIGGEGVGLGKLIYPPPSFVCSSSPGWQLVEDDPDRMDSACHW
ncbi:hypothetical protein PGT21_008111 [Puccinia graminis f. sp. tritici]|uniref:Uncharacterized protein n=1 Tax=Puccinia graminis f. sp. tritici TaxID=56615 RepID=A0A5B0LHX0_PUCGR|nr:hypothetical protein PGTUg99_008081 [Puccinia graminis f. sp. tritici]KAA1065705.1 hypothetical protein PGT21_008111 [Puccinia graminis f. sp. tritici]